MKKWKLLKTLCAYLLVFSILIEQMPQSLFASVWAEENSENEIIEVIENNEEIIEETAEEETIEELPEVTEEPSFPVEKTDVSLMAMSRNVMTVADVQMTDNGSRLMVPEGLGEYQWQRSSDKSNYNDISGATNYYYDLTEDDSKQYLRVVINGTTFVEKTAQVGNVIVFDIAKGVVKLGDSGQYSGIKFLDGTSIKGPHEKSNIYIVKQSTTTRTSNSIVFDGSNVEFDVTIDNVYIGIAPTSCSGPAYCLLDSNSSDNDYSGYIGINAQSAYKKVTLRLKGTNVVRTVRYASANNVNNLLKITDINGDSQKGDSSADGGKLYIPEKIVGETAINEFVDSKKKYNHWNAGIGATDGQDNTYNLEIAGGYVQVLTTYSDNCTAIGAGGNGIGEVTISGGHVVAHSNGTGTAIGGGIGWNNAGGIGYVNITGKDTVVYAENHGYIYRNGDGWGSASNYTEIVGGVAIGCGSSFHSKANTGTQVNIEDATVIAKAAFGNGIGGGNSSSQSGGDATINILGNAKVTASSIGGGNSLKNSGGEATVNVKDSATVTLTNGIGGGTSTHGAGGSATITVDGGTLTCGDTIGGGAGQYKKSFDKDVTTFVGGNATITVNGGTLRAPAIGGGSSAHGNGGTATITVNGGTLDCAGVIGGGAGGYISDTGTKGKLIKDFNGGDANITVTGGTMNAGSIGGGTGSVKGNGGPAIINISELSSSNRTQITTGSIGGGTSEHGAGGATTLEISGGTLNCTGSIGGGAGVYQLAHDDKEMANFTGGIAEITVNGGTLTAASIGGGSGGHGNGGNATITVNRGTLDIAGVIGGGAGGYSEQTGTNGAAVTTFDGGTATITVNGGNLTSRSIGGGKGSINGHGGPAKIVITQEDSANLTMIQTGSIGGGTTLNPDGHLGYATAEISGGDIKGQFIMADAGETPCEFTMTGGKIHDVDLTVSNPDYDFYGTNGAALYMNDDNGVVNISGGSIENCKAENGGAVYMTAGTFKLFSENGTAGLIENCTAENQGGAVYVGGSSTLAGTLTIDGGTISNCDSIEGGAAYLAQGQLTIEDGTINMNEAQYGGGLYLGGGKLLVVGGTITQNTATQSGGAAFVNGGDVEVHQKREIIDETEVVSIPSITQNTAQIHGGAIAVNDGNYTMTGGNIDNNTSLTGRGGGIYVSAATKSVNVEVRSGSLSNNTASVSDGGALAVVGTNDENIKVTVTIGVNELHVDDGNGHVTCEHGINPYLDVEDCPIMNDNKAGAGGGAIYVNGLVENTLLNIFCLTESGSSAEADNGQSNFMKMDGGKVVITSSNTETMDPNNPQNQQTGYGNTHISSSIYVTGGQMEVWGEMIDPKFEDVVTVSVQAIVHWYKDYRQQDENDKWYHIHYYENFPDPNTGEKTGLYKAISVKHGVSQSLPNDMYTHEGYTIVGWTTDAEGLENGNPVENGGKGKYEIGTEYVFDGNPVGSIEIFAQWKLHGYFIEFNPNTEHYTGTEMPMQTATYNVKTKLNKNTYGNPGHVFLGWGLNQNDDDVDFVDEDPNVLNLTNENNAVVPLYAKWAVCDHDVEQRTYTYNLVATNQIRRDCECQGYYQIATVEGEGTPYDQQYHKGSYSIYSSDTAQPWELTVSYQKHNGTGYETCLIPINAGLYRVTISADDISASAVYTISKAEQPTPAKPIEYVEFKSGNNLEKLELIPVAASRLEQEDAQTAAPDSLHELKIHYLGDSNAVLEYQVVFYEGTETISSDWKDASRNTDGKWVATVLADELNHAYTNYYINVRFKECANYKASEVVSSNKYFNIGSATILVVDGEGVTSTLAAADGSNAQNGAYINVTIDDRYYFPEGYFNSITTEQQWKPNCGPGEFGFTFAEEVVNIKYLVSQITDNTIITITLPDARLKPIITSAVEEKQVFGSVEDNAAVISRDSAYTASYKVENYYYDLNNSLSDYTDLSLSFETDLPKGTELILLNKNTKEFYWHTVETAENTISLTNQFIRMGTENVSFVIPVAAMTELQIIVDFSKAETLISAETNLNPMLSAVKRSNEAGIPDGFAQNAVELKSEASFDLAASGQGLVKQFDVSFNESEGAASIWDNVDSALVLTPITVLPADATLMYTANGSTTTSIANSEGKYIVPLGGPESGFATVTLISNSFDDTEQVYRFKADLMTAKSIAESSVMNGTVQKSIDEVIFTSGSQYTPSIKIESEDYVIDKAKDENAVPMFEAEVIHQKANGSEIEMLLMMKDANERYNSIGIYESQNIGNQEEEGLVTFSKEVSGLDNGSYCMRVRVLKNGINVAEVYHYFIIHDSSQPEDPETNS